jgi:predicted CXXCH cytochrome family protein
MSVTTTHMGLFLIGAHTSLVIQTRMNRLLSNLDTIMIRDQSRLSGYEMNATRSLIMMAIILLAGCKSEADPASTTEPTIVVSPTPDQTQYLQAWINGPHSDTYALEKGPNTYCARCHSPANWDPSARIDPPPNCVTCKFPFEAESRIASGNPQVAKSEWENIGCETCHRVQNGYVDPEIAWYDRLTGFYETVTDSTAICGRCHLDNETLNHERKLGDGPHGEFECIRCHDEHSAEADCSDCHPINLTGKPHFIDEHVDVIGNGDCVECHAGAFQNHDMSIQQAGDDNCMGCHGRLMGQTSIALIQYGHSEQHGNVRCVACHDASGFDVGPVEDTNVWMTHRTTEFMGQTSTAPYQSHNLQLLIECQRCHYQDNLWDLDPEIVEFNDGAGN